MFFFHGMCMLDGKNGRLHQHFLNMAVFHLYVELLQGMRHHNFGKPSKHINNTDLQFNQPWKIGVKILDPLLGCMQNMHTNTHYPIWALGASFALAASYNGLTATSL